MSGGKNALEFRRTTRREYRGRTRLHYGCRRNATILRIVKRHATFDFSTNENRDELEVSNIMKGLKGGMLHNFSEFLDHCLSKR